MNKGPKPVVSKTEILCMDFTKGTQYKHWLYKDPETLRKLRGRTHKLAQKAVKANTKEVAARSFASLYGRGSALAVEDEEDGAAMEVEGLGDAAAGSATDNGDAASSPPPLVFVTPEEEVEFQRYMACTIQSTCGRESESIARHQHVQATAMLFVRRFLLSNSLMEYDPKLLMLASIFLASKVENEYIRVDELMAIFSMEGEGKLREVIDFEMLLLQGLAFDLHVLHAYNPYQGLIKGLENMAAMKNVEAHKRLEVSAKQLRQLGEQGRITIDVLQLTDVALLFPPARIALAVLIDTGKQCYLSQQVDAFIELCFKEDEDEEEYDAIMVDVNKVLQVIAQEREEGGNLSLAFQPTQHWRSLMAKEAGERQAREQARNKKTTGKLKRVALWSSKKGAPGGGKKRKSREAEDAPSTEG